MTRTFVTLASTLTIALLATIGVGFISFFTDDLKDDAFMWHFNLGLFTSMGVLLVHCLIFTYFLGTGRWVKEVGIAYKLPDEPWPKLTRELKRISFPPALFAMLTAIAAVAAGAGAQLQEWPWYIHATLAFVTLGVNLWAFVVEYRCLDQNAAVIREVLAEVDRIRAEHGLPSNEEALAQQEMPVANSHQQK